MLEKLKAIKDRWDEVERELSSPEAINDMKRYAQLNKEYKDLGKIVEQYHIYKNMVSNIDTNKDILANEKEQELREMAKEELEILLEQKETKEEEIRQIIIPKDPKDSKKYILEKRSGAGG